MLGTLNIIFKGVVGVTVMMWVRWTLPRLRIDQVITTCLKYCVPIAAVAFLGATLWQYALPNRTFFGALDMPPAAYQLAELLPDNDDRADQPANETAPADDQTAATAHCTQWNSRSDGTDLLAVVLLPAVRGDRVRVCGRRGGQHEHRADGVLSGAVAGGDGRACSSWPGPISSARCNF